MTIVEPTANPPAAMPTTRITFLRRALLLDAAFDGAMGAAVALAAEPLADLLGLPSGLLRGVGVGLILFAALLAYLGSRERVSPPAARSVVAGNLLWVAGCLLLLAAGWVEPTALGVALVVAQAFAVALFAGLEELGRRRALPAAP